LSFVTDSTALNYIKDFPQDQQPQDFKLKFPFASDEAIDLMRGMMQFNPFFRLSIEECLAHPFFSKIRKKEREVK
jgi:mitogen-activated protein kinase 1/3